MWPRSFWLQNFISLLWLLITEAIKIWQLHSLQQPTKCKMCKIDGEVSLCTGQPEKRLSNQSINLTPCTYRSPFFSPCSPKPYVPSMKHVLCCVDCWCPPRWRTFHSQSRRTQSMCVRALFFHLFTEQPLQKWKKATNNACNSMSELLCALFRFCGPTGALCLPMSWVRWTAGAKVAWGSQSLSDADRKMSQYICS